MGIGDEANIEIVDHELTNGLRRVFETLDAIGDNIGRNKWCLIGGLMVETILRERGRSPLRPTDDGNIVGNLASDSGVLRRLSSLLRDSGFSIANTGFDDVGVRHIHDDGTIVDLLGTDNSGHIKNAWTPAPGKTTLLAPGSDQAIRTARLVRIQLGVDGTLVILPIPTLAGALYAKVSSWMTLASSPERSKHLHDAAQMLCAASVDELTVEGDWMMAPKATLKRWRTLETVLADERSDNWGLVPMHERLTAIARVQAAIARSA